MELVWLILGIVLSPAIPYTTFHIQTKPLLYTHMLIYAVTILMDIPDQSSYLANQHNDKA